MVNLREAPPGQWGVYMVRCVDGTLYTGATCDLERRLATHNRGRGAAYTRARLPVVAVYWEPAADKRAALSREWHLKQLSRAEKLLLHRAASRRRRSGPKAPGAKPREVKPREVKPREVKPRGATAARVTPNVVGPPAGGAAAGGGSRRGRARPGGVRARR